jgi:hypothetical protein
MSTDSPDLRPLGSLAAARDTPDGVVILEGDYGGQIYLVAPAALVECSEGALELLLRDLDELAWPGSEADASSVRYEELPLGAGVPGGMGGGKVTGAVWIHPDLSEHAEAIRAVLTGEREALA